MKQVKDKSRIGIAAFLEKKEIKDYFDTLFFLIGGIEFIIFIVHFIGSMGPGKGPFPWKQYFFVSFLAPVVLMFIVGLIVVGFNYYLFGNQKTPFDLEENPFVGTRIKRFGHSFKFLFSILQQVPVLVGLFVLGIGSVVLFKLDAILKVLGHIGEKAAFYLFVILCVLVSGTLVFLLLWLYGQFKLHKYQIQRQWEYRHKVIETAGLIILDNNVICDRDGNIISPGEGVEAIENQTVETPPVAEKRRLK